MTDFITLTIDNQEVQVPKGSTIMDAANKLGIEIPHFCYHKRLSVAGNCRMCLVEVEGAPKPVASCHWPVAEGMVVNTQSQMSKEARKGTMAFLLANHPLDCPICDQAGECALQDQAVAYGADRSHFTEAKRAVKDKDIGSKVKTVMTRCIHCMRCVRFATEIAGVEEMGALFRGEDTKVGTYIKHALQSELAGNMIDLCPVGALTNKPYAFTLRSWEMDRTEGIDLMDTLGSHMHIDSRAGRVMRFLPREYDEVNEEWMTDAARFSVDACNVNRMESPMIKSRRTLQTAGWDKALNAVQMAVKGVRRNRIAGVSGDIQSAEDLLAFDMFMKDVIGTPHVDCRPAGYTHQVKNKMHRMLNTPLQHMEQADAIILIGANPRLEAPLLNLRLSRAVKRGAKVAQIGAFYDQTYDVEHLGSGVDALRALLDEKTRFSKILQNAKTPLVIVSEKAILHRPDAAAWMGLIGELVEKHKVATDAWNGFNLIPQSVGVLNGLEMGALPDEGGMTTAEIFEAAEDGKIDILFVYGGVNVPSTVLNKVKKLVHISTHHTFISEIADIVLPVATFTEKQGLYINAMGMVQHMGQAVKPPLHAKEDWKVFRALSDVFGKPLPFNNLNDVRQHVFARSDQYVMLEMPFIGAWTPIEKEGDCLKFSLEDPVRAYYQSNSFLRVSPTMYDCQTDVGAVKSKIIEYKEV